MSEDDMTMGEVCDELQALGSKAYVGPNGRVWKLRYIGELSLADWEAPFLPFPDLKPKRSK